jgi:uncharacterized cupin superfamily protein
MPPARLTLPALDPAGVKTRIGTSYPAPYAAPCAGREKQALGDATGLTQFGVNLVRVKPGVWSSQRHWHAREDEFVYVIEGELVLVTEAGEQVLTRGMCAGFPAGKADGHHLINRTTRDAVYLEVGTRRTGDDVDYPDCDMQIRNDTLQRKDGTPY